MGFRNLKLVSFCPTPLCLWTSEVWRWTEAELNRFYMELSRHWPQDPGIDWALRIGGYNHMIIVSVRPVYWHPAFSYYLVKVMNSPSQSQSLPVTHHTLQFVSLRIMSVHHFTSAFYNFWIRSFNHWETVIPGIAECEMEWGLCCDQWRRSSFVTIIQTHCVQYSGVLVNIKDDTVTRGTGERVMTLTSECYNITNRHDQSPAVWEAWRHQTSIGNFYRIDINSLHFSNHYSLCERQFPFIW